MSTNRYSRITTLLSEQPMSIIPLTSAINQRFDRTYSPSLIGGDVKILIFTGVVQMDDHKIFSMKKQGVSIETEPVVA